MYDEMTNSDFICTLLDAAHPPEQPSAENAALMDEAARRIRKLEAQVREWESAADNGSGCDTPEELRNFINCYKLLWLTPISIHDDRAQ